MPILYILDTDHLSLIQSNHPNVVAAVKRHRRTDVLGLTTITIEEQFNGRIKKLRAARTPLETALASQAIADGVTLWASFALFSMSVNATTRFESLLKLKLNVGRMDLRIAAIALEANATVVSRNLRDFGRVPGLTVADWSV